MIVMVLFLVLTTSNVFALPTNQNDKVVSNSGKKLSNNLEKLVQKQIKSYHWKVSSLNYNEISNSLNNNEVEVIWSVELKHKLDYDKPESVPALKGKIRRYNELKSNLPVNELDLIQRDLDSWKSNLTNYINEEQDMSEYIKITAIINDENQIVAGSVKEYIQDGEEFVAADDFIKVPDLASQEKTAYENLEKDTIRNAKANDPNTKSSVITPNFWVDYYHPSDAVAYANKWVKNTTNPCKSGSSTVQNSNNYNPAYSWYQCNDCANYVSQCLYAGGIPTDATWKPNSSTWIQAYPLVNYMVNNSYAVQYSYATVPVGGIAKDLNVEHVYIVTYNDGSVVKCNAHSNDRLGVVLSSSYSAAYYKISRNIWVN